MSTSRLALDVSRFARRAGLLIKGDRVVVAVSGGLDSRVLLELLRELQPSLNLQLVLAHLNHQLRGDESTRDEQFVCELARSLDLPLDLGRADDLKRRVGGGRSLQDIAREQRYAFLQEVRRRHDARVIALGHTRTDQAETVLMRLIRGAGPGGLAGIAASRGETIVRPLLETGRETLLSYALEHRLQWVEDSSNAKPIYFRNQVRHKVLPVLRELNPRIEVTLSHLAGLSRRDEALLEALTREYLQADWIEHAPDRVTLDRGLFLELNPALQYRVLRSLASELAGPSPDDRMLEQVHLKAAMELINEVRGTRSLSWPGSLLLTVTPARICLSRGASEQPSWQGETDLVIPGKVRLPDGSWCVASESSLEAFVSASGNRMVCWLDAGSVSQPLRVRYPRRGDRFHPLGAPLPTRLSEFFIRQKVPRDERFRTPLVLSGEEIVWVAGMRSAEPGKLDSKSLRVLRLELVTARTLEENDVRLAD